MLFLFSFNSQADIKNGENIVFRSVKVAGTHGNYLISGKTKLKSGYIYYNVEDGHFQYIAETNIQISRDDFNWNEFQIEIQIHEDKLPDNGSLILNLYERTNKNQMTNIYPVLLECFIY
jgi:hypothetical protein